MIAVGSLIPIYLAFVAKHLMCDFFLQTAWMALGKEKTEGWVAPLFVHAGIHALSTLIVVLVVLPAFWWLALVDLVIHAAIDRGKGVVCRGLGLSPSSRAFWWALGIDQALHHVTHFVYVLLLLTA